MQGHRHIRVVVSEESVFDVERSLVEVLGFAQVAAGGVQRGEVVVVHAELVVDRAERGLEDRDQPSVQRLGLVESLLFLHQGRQRGEVRGNRDVIGAEHRFTDLHRPAGVDLAVNETAPGVLDAPQVVPDRRRIEVVGARAASMIPSARRYSASASSNRAAYLYTTARSFSSVATSTAPVPKCFSAAVIAARYSRSAASSRPRVRCSRAELEVTVIRAGTTVSSSLWRSRIAAARR